MEITSREFGRRPSWVLAAVAAGETVTVTENGITIARVVPVRAETPPYPADPTGEIDLPDPGLREPAGRPEEDHGPVTEAERAAARAELDELDAEHDRRRRRQEERAGGAV
ncbi:type II toxin-antitoxin system prevent-host-death family antitoxin [Streptomyces sp. SID2131]|nr:type II toxin-antitoxin system prevent-host-death family antitoxin [Streptomyces sp. SID2131]